MSGFISNRCKRLVLFRVKPCFNRSVVRKREECLKVMRQLPLKRSNDPASTDHFGTVGRHGGRNLRNILFELFLILHLNGDGQ